MAKFYLGKGFDEYLSQIEDLANQSDEIAGKVIYSGAKVAIRKFTDAIKTIPESNNPHNGILPEQKQGLLDGAGITKMEINSGGTRNVKIGVSGCNNVLTKNFPKGQPNVLIARAVNSGTSIRPKNRFSDTSMKNAEGDVVTAMQNRLDDEISKIMK